MKIIDAHVHIARYVSGFGAQGELHAIGGGMVQYADGSTFQMIPLELGETGVSPEAVISLMDAHEIERAVLLQGNYIGLQNTYVHEAVQKYPSRFIGAGAYDPFCRKKEDIRTYLFEKCGFKLVKFEVSTGSGLMSYHRYFALDGDILREEFEYARDMGLTMVFDIGRQRNDCWQPMALAKMAREFSSVNFVVCHLLAPQGANDMDAWLDAMRALNLPNVWFDMASLPSNQRPEKYPYPTATKYLTKAIDILGKRRIMFGSDIPSNLCRDTYLHYIDHIAQNSAIPDDEKENILYNTAKEIYVNK